ncbi:MAG: cytochrome ubiquinol oxidase subunit I [Elusimicrobiales bacterium]
MDVLTLSRLQFAATAAFHFLFVPLTLGLCLLTAWMETVYVRTGDADHLRMARFWGKLFLINFTLGVVTGLTLEFQFGTNWARYARFVGDVFGAPLAIEATTAFFLESTFLAVWLFGWERLTGRAHAAAMWLVSLGVNMSALWIILANGWMQHPVGYAMAGGRAEMVDFAALALNYHAWLQFFHTVLSGYVTAGFFVMGVSAWHLVKKNETAFFRKSFRIAALFSLASSLALFVAGDLSGRSVAELQPAKFAAMESVWETRSGAPYVLLTVPEPAAERNSVEAFKVPYLLSLMAFHRPGAEVKGLKAFPAGDRPPVLPVFLGFRVMIALGILFILLSGLALYFSKKEILESRPRFLRLLIWVLPLPYLAIQAGWLVTEMGRQPWLVYGLMRVSEGVSESVSAGQVRVSLAGLVIFYSILGALDVYLLAKTARKGPEAAA